MCSLYNCSLLGIYIYRGLRNVETTACTLDSLEILVNWVHGMSNGSFGILLYSDSIMTPYFILSSYYDTYL